MKHLKFQQNTTDAHQPRPWPVIVNDLGDIVHGRPDAHHLVGFGPLGGYEVTVTRAAAFVDPASVVGLRPVFQCRGEMFAVDQPVGSCEPYEADAAAIEQLVAGEAKMRAVLD